MITLKRPAGTGTITKDGYHRVTRNGRQVMEHRDVMEKHIGHRLARNQDVHHKNLIKLDNVPSNLNVMTKSAHSKLHNVAKGRKCTVLGCDARHYAKSLCRTHYMRCFFAGYSSPRSCSFSGCHKPVHARDMCRTHYAQWLRARS